MKFGGSTFITDEGITAAELGVALEERGFDSIFLAEHTHIPAGYTPPPDYPDGKLPRQYFRALDPFVTLGFVAAATERLRLGTGVTLVAQRDPIVLAKEVATLDLLSGGRAVLGVGIGWNLAEVANHGIDPAVRLAVARERLRAIKEIWAHDAAEFHGRHVDFDPIHVWPKPVQRPGPPVLIGGCGPSVPRRVVEDGDGWLVPPMQTVEDVATRLPELRRHAERVGRAMPALYGNVMTPDPAVIERYAELGADHVVFSWPTTSRDDTLRQLDEFAAKVMG